MASLEQVTVPAQDRVRADQQQEVAQPLPREVVEQAGEDHAVGVGEGGLANLALQDQQVVPEREVSRRRESHPPPLAEPCGSLSAHTAPIVQPSGLRPNRQWANRFG